MRLLGLLAPTAVCLLQLREWARHDPKRLVHSALPRELVAVVRGRIVKELPMIKGRAVDRAWAANLRADSALYVLEKDSRSAVGDRPAVGTGQDG